MAIFLRLAHYTKPYWWAYGIALAGYILFAGGNILLVDFLQFLLDSLGGDGISRGIIDRLLEWSLGFGELSLMTLSVVAPILVVLFSLMRACGLVTGDFGLAVVVRGVIHDLRIKIFSNMLIRPVHTLDQNQSGEQVANHIYKVDQVTAVLSNAVTVVIREGLLIVGLFAYLLYLSWQLTTVLILTVPFIVLLIRIASSYLRRYSARIQNSVGKIVQLSQDTIRNFREILIYAGEKTAQKDFAATSDYYRRQQFKVALVSVLLQGIIQMCLAVALALLLFFALNPELVVHFTTGQLVAYIAAAAMVAKPARQLTQTVPIFQRAKIALIDIFEIFDAEPEPNSGTYQAERAAGRIVFDDVCFSYPNGKQALSNFSLVIEPGQIVALVGSSGAGKSTLFNLLTRFYQVDPGNGLITLDGVNLNDWELHNLRRQMSLVPQKPVILGDTLKNNIAFGAMHDASDREIESVVETAQIKEFSSSLPLGLETNLGQTGVALSGGQEQRIAIARALLKNAPVQLLDEPTTALDTETSRQLQQALRALLKGHTTIIIAHQLNTVMHADLIGVLDAGRLVESGSHEQLLKQGGLYKRLFEMDFQGI